MSFSDYLSISGIAVSVLFGIVGVYLAVRKAKYPASLTFILEQSISLLDDFAHKLPNLLVTYKDQPIERSIILISGFVANDGSLDISKEMVEVPLSCTLPDKCSWLEFKVTNTAESLNVKSEIVNNNVVEVELGLFRRNESFSFQAIAQLDESYAKTKLAEFPSKIKWKHRIASLGNVKYTQLPLPSTSSKKSRVIKKVIFSLLALFYMYSGISDVTGLGPLGQRLSIIYKIEKGNTAQFVWLVPNRDGTTQVVDINTNNKTNERLDTYVIDKKITPIWSDKRKGTKYYLVSGIAMFLAGLTMLYAPFSQDIRRYRLRKLINTQNQKKTSDGS